MNSNPSIQATIANQQLGRFCTACGVFNPNHHSFCDNCGLQMQLPKAAPDASQDARGVSGPLRPPLHKQLRWLAPGAAISCVLVAILATVIWSAVTPPPNGQEVLEALRSDQTRVTAPAIDLLCIKNLPYQRHQIQLSPDDAATRNWLESLVQAGLYAPGVEVFPDEMTGSTLLQFQALPALSKWRRNGSLCVAEQWEIESVPTHSIHKSSRTDRMQYVASVLWRAKGTAPWLNYLTPISVRLPGVMVDARGLTTKTQHTLERVNGQWKAVDD